MSLIKLTNAGKKVGSKWLVRGIDLSLNAGEIVTLIGPNGSGKSTTAKMALGILQTSEGTAKRSPELSVGYVPQKFTLDWTLPLTVARLMRLTTRLREGQIDEALELVGILHLKNADAQNLSGGEFQRALLARAIARKPNLLVLDEPVQGVDYAGEISLYALIADIRKQLNCAVLLISHDLHIVMAATDRVLCLNGHVCCHGTPADVSKTDEYHRLFGQSASSPIAVYEHNHDHTHLADGRVQHADGSLTDHCHNDDGHHHNTQDK